MSDTALQRAIMQALADNSRVHADEIAAQVIDGDVVLHGTVGSIVQRDEVALTVRAVPGVRHIDNDLRVDFLDSDRRTDADTGAAVVDALTADGELRRASFDVHSKAGTVTLRGVVERPELRGKAAQIALGVPGVRDVRNRLESAR
jgi:osmotically-inducible protein OsmY